MRKEEEGIERVVVNRALCESSDDCVPGKVIGFLHLGENRTGALDTAVGREGVEAEDFGGGEGVVDLAGFDKVGVDLSQVSDGFA